MKKSPAALVVLCFAVLSFTPGAFGNPKSDDGGLDGFLSRVNVEAEGDIAGFKTKLSAHFGADRSQVDIVLKTADKPADAYMIFRIARLANKPVDSVLRTYEGNKQRGWGHIAKTLGIQPGSREFHALKKGEAGFLGNKQEEGVPGKGRGRGRGRNQND